MMSSDETEGYFENSLFRDYDNGEYSLNNSNSSEAQDVAYENAETRPLRIDGDGEHNLREIIKLKRIKEEQEYKISYLEALKKDFENNLNQLEESNAYLLHAKNNLEKEMGAIKDHYEEELEKRIEENQNLEQSLRRMILELKETNKSLEKDLLKEKQDNEDTIFELDSMKQKYLVLEQENKQYQRNEEEILKRLKETELLNEAEIRQNVSLSEKVKELEEVSRYKDEQILTLKDQTDSQSEDIARADLEVKKLKHALDSCLANDSIKETKDSKSSENKVTHDNENIPVPISDEISAVLANTQETVRSFVDAETNTDFVESIYVRNETSKDSVSLHSIVNTFTSVVLALLAILLFFVSLSTKRPYYVFTDEYLYKFAHGKIEGMLPPVIPPQ